MIQKPKRPTKINNQDNKQPQTITELIRRYDLDNAKIYDFLDDLVEQLNFNTTENDEKLNKIESKISETILYENEAGTVEDIVLNQSVENAREVKICMQITGDKLREDISFNNPNGRNCNIEINYASDTGDTLYSRTESILISGTTITRKQNGRAVAMAVGTNGNILLSQGSSGILIYKVIAYY